MLIKEKMKYKLALASTAEDEVFDQQLDSYINCLETTHFNMV